MTHRPPTTSLHTERGPGSVVINTHPIALDLHAFGAEGEAAKPVTLEVIPPPGAHGVLPARDGRRQRVADAAQLADVFPARAGMNQCLTRRSIEIRQQKPAVHQSTGKQRARPDHEHYLFSEDVWQRGIAGSPTSRQFDIIGQGRDADDRARREFRQVVMVESEKQEACGTACQDESGAWKNHR